MTRGGSLERGKPAPREQGGALAKMLVALVVLAILATGYVFFVLNWNYSEGERAGWVQKLSRKGVLCKTWEGELAMVTMPGATPEKFFFTVWDDAVAEQINRLMGHRVSLHYQEKIGIPTTCFGETQHYVDRVIEVREIPLGPGVMVPIPKEPVPGETPAPK